MPKVNGYRVAEAIRRVNENGVSPTLIAVTAYNGVEDRRMSTEVGFDMHLVKPVRPDFLRKAMDLLDQSRLLRVQISQAAIQHEKLRGEAAQVCTGEKQDASRSGEQNLVNLLNRLNNEAKAAADPPKVSRQVLELLRRLKRVNDSRLEMETALATALAENERLKKEILQLRRG